MADHPLPPDAVAFLAEGRSLDYDASATEAGEITLHRDPPAVSLEVVSGDSDWADHDPRAGDEGHYAVPALDLVATCDDFDPSGILIWLPIEGCFGTWDADHWSITTFPDVTWQDIVDDPATYLDAQWNGLDDGTELDPVGRHTFVSDA